MIDINTQNALSREMRQAYSNFEKKTLPTILEVSVGAPNAIEGISDQAKGLKSFANNMKRALTDIAGVHFRTQADSTITEGGKLTRSASYAKAKLEQARQDFAAKLSYAEPELERLNTILNQAKQPPTSAGQAAVDAELRAYIKALEPSKAISEIRANPDLMQAVARAPAVLSGLSADFHKAVVDDYLQMQKPAEFNQREDLTASMRAALQAINFVETEANSLIDFQTAARLDGLKSTLAAA
jgi:hypothetical protein